MMDRIRVAHMHDSALGHAVQDRPKMTMVPGIVLDLTTDWLAMQEIVAALAANQPLYIDAYQDERCAICEAEVRGWNDAPLAASVHAEFCPYRRAVSLIGPASDANPIESDGVGTSETAAA